MNPSTPLNVRPRGNDIADAWRALTRIQREVVWDRAQGYSLEQIAARRCVSSQTIRCHINSAFKILPRNGCESRSRMMWVAYQLGKEGLQP